MDSTHSIPGSLAALVTEPRTYIAELKHLLGVSSGNALGERLGISGQAVSKVEKKASRIPATWAAKVARALNGTVVPIAADAGEPDQGGATAPPTSRKRPHRGIRVKPKLPPALQPAPKKQSADELSAGVEAAEAAKEGATRQSLALETSADPACDMAGGCTGGAGVSADAGEPIAAPDSPDGLVSCEEGSQPAPASREAPASPATELAPPSVQSPQPLRLTLALGTGVAAGVFQREQSWPDLARTLMKEPEHDDITVEQYQRLTKDERKLHKARRGYYLPARLRPTDDPIDKKGTTPASRAKANLERVYALKLDVELNEEAEARLAGDPDAPKGDASPEDISAVLGDLEHFLHPSRSSIPGDRRWRLLIPLTEGGLLPEAASRLAHYLCDRLEEAGIAVDRGSSTDLVRPAFWPTLSANQEWDPIFVPGRPASIDDVPTDYQAPSEFTRPKPIDTPKTWEPVDLASLDLSESVLERIAERRSDGEQRHRQIFGVCCALVRKGLDDGTILRILADPANGVSDKVLEKGHGNPEAGMRWVATASLAPAREEVEAERDVGRMFEASDDTEPDSVQGEEAPTVLAGPALWEHRNKDAIDQLFEAEGLNAEEDRERIRQAAGLPPLTYDREAASIAKELGCSKKTLRRIVDRYRALMNLAPETSRGVAESAESGGGGDPHDGGGIADGVLALMTHVPLVRNEENDVFALVDVNGHREVLPLGGKASAMTDFRMRVLRMTKDAGIARYIPDESWANIWGSLRSDALTGEDEQSVHLRCASHGDRHYVDLCDPQWRVVEISPSGWRVIPGKDAPVLFRRTANMHPLPVPETGGDVDRLWRYVTIAEAHRPLFLAVLLSFFRTTLAYPILVLTGMEGSGKTTASRTVGELVDPKKAPTRGLPHASKDLHVRAHNNYLLAMENVSSIGDEMSDTLCRVSTGSGDAARSLYTDMDESVVEYQRPIILEGITFFLNKPDLISRSVHLEIPPLPEGQRRTDAELKARFQADKPRILGALFSLLASALALMPKVPVPGDDIRLLDFAHFGETLYRLLGLSGSPGKVSFVEHLTEVQAETRAHAMEASPTAFALVRYLRDQYEVARKQHEEDPVLYPHRPVVHYWRGTPGELLDTLTDRDVLPRGRYREGWVRSAKGMAELLRRFRKPLEEAGITVERIGRRGMGTRYELIYTPKPEDTGAGK